jgi:AcrR family transcriptional regulator
VTMAARRNPPLTRDEIVVAAMALTATVGLDDLSMRALATELGVTPMALYHHTGDRDGLVGLVADAVVAGVAAPDDDVPWDAWLTSYHDALWRRLRGYTGVALYLLEHPSTPAGAAIRRRTVDILVAAGFSDRDALLASSTFHTHLLGRLAIEALSTDDIRADEPAWRSHGLSADDYVRHGLATIIAGLRVSAPTVALHKQ